MRTRAALTSIQALSPADCADFTAPSRAAIRSSSANAAPAAQKTAANRMNGAVTERVDGDRGFILTSERTFLSFGFSLLCTVSGVGGKLNLSINPIEIFYWLAEPIRG
jgi:hypothetical protein